MPPFVNPLINISKYAIIKSWKQYLQTKILLKQVLL